MMHEHFRAALEGLDVGLARKMWQHIFPGMPQPTSDDDALIVIHIARTATNSLDFKHRAWSHAWLRERAIPSKLPDHLRPRAERIYPVLTPAVGIAVHTNTPIALEIRRAMEGAVRDVGVKDSRLTKRAILAARSATRKSLLGIE